MKILSISAMLLGHSLIIEEYKNKNKDIIEIVGGVGLIALGMFMATI